MSSIDCIVLAGGLGTRLQSVVSDRPKPLALINGVPFLSLLMQNLIASGLIRKAIMAIGYKADAIVEFFHAHAFSIPVEFSCEEQPLGTGGAVKKALEKTTSEHVLILNGDTYLEFSLQSFWEEHVRLGEELTLIYTQVADVARYGQLEIDDQKKQVLAYREKNTSGGPGFINAGIYLCRREILDPFTLPEPFALEREIFPHLVKRGMGAFYAPGLFIDIGTPDSFREAQNLLAPLTIRKE